MDVGEGKERSQEEEAGHLGGGERTVAVCYSHLQSSQGLSLIFIP